MKNKIVFFLVLILLVFTGCTIDYNLEFNDDIFNEDFVIYEINSQNYKTDIYGGRYGESIIFDDMLKQLNIFPQSVLTNQPIDIYDPMNKLDGTLYYDKELIEKENLHSIEFKARSNLESMKYLNSVRQCYDKLNVSVNSDRISISTSEVNLCFDNYSLLDKININLNLNFSEDFVVVENNATMVDENKYTWIIDRSNYNNQSINIVIDRSPDKDKKTDLSMTLLIVFGIVLVISGIIYLLFRIRSKRINKI